eukprot:tig00001408_g8601.t1
MAFVSAIPALPGSASFNAATAACEISRPVKLASRTFRCAQPTAAEPVSDIRMSYEPSESSNAVSRRQAFAAAIALAASSLAPTPAFAALKRFVDTSDGYELSYPNGWLQYPFKKGGPDVGFRDLINEEETISVFITPTDPGKSVEALGTPEEVGKRIAASEGGDFVTAKEVTKQGVKFYEFELTTASPKLHKVGAVAISRGKVYTLTASTSEKRWGKVKPQFQEVIKQFRRAQDPTLMKEGSNALEMNSSA